MFNEFISKNNLLDLSFSSFEFSWYNGCSRSAHRWARLDRCLVNIDWITFNNNCFISHLPRICSNHSPLLLTTWAQVHTRNRVFRFGNYWLEYPRCHKTVKNAWNFYPHSNPMHAFSHLLSIPEEIF